MIVVVTWLFEVDFGLYSIFSHLFSLIDFRVLGGLLGTYDLSGDKIFLEKARELADKLLPAWDSPTGIPFNRINLAHGNVHNPSWTGVCSVLTSYHKCEFSVLLMFYFSEIFS